MNSPGIFNYCSPSKIGNHLKYVFNVFKLTSWFNIENHPQDSKKVGLFL